MLTKQEILKAIPKLNELKDHEKKIIFQLIEEIYNLREIIELVPGNLYWKNLNHVYQGCNKNLAEHINLKNCRDIKDKTAFHYLSEKDAIAINAIDENIIRQGKAVELEEVGFNQTKTFLTKKIPLRNNEGEIRGLLGISLDITARKEAEEKAKKALAAEAAAEKAKSQLEQELRQAIMVLSGSIAHDLRTPLSVLGLSHSMLRKSLPALLEAYQKTSADSLGHQPLSPSRLDMLQSLCERMDETTRQMNENINATLNSLSKAVLGNLQTADLLPCSMYHCMHNILSRYPYQEKESDLIQWDRTDFTFLGNFILFARVINNLIKNSLEQIKKNQGGKIFITTEELKDKYILRFKDTAGGAPPEIAERLFDGYQTTKVGGTGVGLAFCKITMQSFNGNIECDSKHGNYIEFLLSFPKVTQETQQNS